MRKFNHFYALTTLLIGCLLAACHSDVDLNNIDPKAEVDMGLAIPVGTIRATMGDFLGNGKVDRIYVDEDGIFHFMDTVDIPQKDYRTIDVTSYILKNTTTLHFKIEDRVATTTINPSPVTIPLKFDLKLGLQGINDNINNERIDSIWVTEAKFHSIINVSDFDLNWSEIESVQLVLGKEFIRPAGDTIDIPIAGHRFGDRIAINVDNFTLNLLKDDVNFDPALGTVNEINFQIIFNVRPTHSINVSSNSSFDYDLQVDVIDYAAIWGFFQAGNQMRDERRLSLDSVWGGWEQIKRLKVRFAEPQIEVFVSHKIAAPLRMYINYITAIDSAGNSTSATWDGDTKTDFDLKNSLCPLVSSKEDLKDSVYNSRMFSYEPSKGHLDRLFDVRPDSFLYSFHLLVDQNPRSDYPWKQHRITKDASVHGYAIADIPFKFNEGSEFQYSTTIPDVDLSKLSLESLLEESNAVNSVEASDLKLVLTVRNGIPFDIDGTFTFLNKDSVPMSLQVVEDSTVNHILFPAPAMTKPAGMKYGIVGEPSVTNIVISVDKEKFDQLAEVKHIHLDAAIAGNPQPCQIDTACYLSVKIGVAAHVDAVLNLDNKNNNQ